MGNADPSATNSLSMDYLLTGCALSNTTNDCASESHVNECNHNLEDQDIDEYEMYVEDFINHMDTKR